MNRTISSGKAWRVLPPALLLSASLVCGGVQAVSATTAGSVAEATQDIRIVDILPLNSTTVEVIFSNPSPRVNMTSDASGRDSSR